MATIPYWYPSPHQFDGASYESPPNVWDIVAMNSVFLPGIAKVKATKGRKMDVKQSPGSHGATITDMGYKPGRVDITLTIWTPSQWLALQQMFNGSNTYLNLEPKPNTQYNAPSVTIDHPATQLHQIASVIIEEIDGPEESSRVHGGMDFKFKCVQFFPSNPKLNATNTPAGTITPQPNALTAKDPSSNPIPGPS